MKILFVGLARAIWLFDFAAINPSGKSLQGVIEELAKRYNFGKAPSSIIDLAEKNSLAFTAGTFTNSKDIPTLVSLNMYNDGFVADTMSSSNDSDDFLRDLIGWMVSECGLKAPTTVRAGYVSQIDFECEVPLSKINPHLDEFTKVLEQIAKPADGKVRRFDLGAIHFWTEDATVTGAPAIVKFERKLNAPFSANHYFSQAPVETEVHVALIEEFEALMKASR